MVAAPSKSLMGGGANRRSSLQRKLRRTWRKYTWETMGLQFVWRCVAVSRMFSYGLSFDAVGLGCWIKVLASAVRSSADNAGNTYMVASGATACAFYA